MRLGASIGLVLVLLAGACGGRSDRDQSRSNAGQGGSAGRELTAEGGVSSTSGGTAGAAGSEPPSAAGSTSCDEGRAGWQALWDDLEPNARECSVDDDCIYTSFGDECHAVCALPINKYRVSELGEPIYDHAGANCLACPLESFDQCPAGEPPDVHCDNGTCQYVTPWQ